MKGISIRVEDELHRRLKRIVFEKDISVQDFVHELLVAGIEMVEDELRINRERGGKNGPM